MKLNLDHLNLSVRSLEASLEWYGRVFGFENVEAGIYGGSPWAIVRNGDSMLCLYEHPELDPPAGTEKSHGLNHFGIRIRDKASWEETVKAQNLKINYGGPSRWPHSTAWYVNDPTGHEIEVLYWDHDEIRFPA